MPRGVGVIQGDGINHHTIHQMLEAVMQAGFSAQASSDMRGLGVVPGHGSQYHTFTER